MSNEYKDHLYNSIKDFAITVHKGQFRKYNKEPYIMHCIRVAEIIRKSSTELIELIDLDLLNDLECLAYLHDTVEDTNTSLKDIEERFGNHLSELVYQLTNQSKSEDGNRKIRKEIDKNHLLKASIKALIVKMADIIDNCSDIMIYDKSFGRKYINEKKDLLKALKDRITNEDSQCQRLFNLLYNKCQSVLDKELEQ